MANINACRAACNIVPAAADEAKLPLQALLKTTDRVVQEVDSIEYGAPYRARSPMSLVRFLFRLLQLLSTHAITYGTFDAMPESCPALNQLCVVLQV